MGYVSSNLMPGEEVVIVRVRAQPSDVHRADGLRHRSPLAQRIFTA